MAVVIAVNMINPKMRFVCVKSGNDFTSGTIYPVQYDDCGKLFVIDNGGNRRPTSYPCFNKNEFFTFMKKYNMVKLED